MSARFVVILLALALCPALPVHAQRTLTVSAGEFDRRDTIVPVSLPPSKPGAALTLVDENGASVPLQFGPDGRCAFILGELKAGQTRTYRVDDAPGAAASIVTVERNRGVVEATYDRRPILHYQGAKTRLPEGYEPHLRRGGYIHPVFTPEGNAITDDYPPKHKHHHGIWSPWTDTRFEGRTPDFWNMFKKTGTVEPKGFADLWGGPVAGGFTATHQFVDLSDPAGPKPALDEKWEVVVYRPLKGARPLYVFDWTSTQTCATKSPLVLPKYHYGGLGFRGHRDWDGKANCVFLTSEGKGRSNGNETTGKWCYVGGKVDDDAMGGVAILCHPENFRFPQPMRLHPEEPFFCYAPSQGGDWSIEPGKPYVAKYRFVVMDGSPDAKEIERLWNDYASPPKVTVGN